MSTSLIVTIIVAAFLIFFLIWGYHRGFLRILLTTMVLVATVVVAGVLAPYFSNLIRNTFIGEGIDKRIGTYLEKNIDNPLINSVHDAQETVIGNLPLPEFMREDISEKNTAAEYVELQVSNFTEYLRNRLTTIAVNCVSYAILLVLIYIAFRILLGLSRAINKVPIVGGVNKITGALLGLLEGLLLIWCLGLIVMMISGTPFGTKIVSVIEENAFLKFLYDKNGIVLGVNALFKSFLG